MITTVSSYQASDGTVHRTLDEAKVHELGLLMLSSEFDTSKDMIQQGLAILVSRSTEVRQILRKRERKPKVRKATRKGGKQAKPSEGAVETPAPAAA